ncbi:uncharacterized protein METZ01_LOCUS262877, partial [marine metagenome]
TNGSGNSKYLFIYVIKKSTICNKR